jgi:hypothetical protein
MKINLCKPLLVYVIYYLISFISGFILFPDIKKVLSIKYLISTSITFTLHCLVLYFLCSKKYIKTAWVIAIIPIILGIVVTILALSLKLASPKKQIENNE